MGFIFSNPNPDENKTGDCVIRAISIATGKPWDDVSIELFVKAHAMKDMRSTNRVWGAYLNDLGYKRTIIPDTCPDCYTVIDFTKDHPTGTFILGTGTHVVTVKNGNYYDTWDSGNELPIYYWTKED